MKHLRMAGAAAIAAAVAITGFGIVPAAADTPPDQSVSVDLTTQLGEPSGVGRGFLYGLSFDGSKPGDDLLLPLKPTSFRSGGEIDEPGSFGWGAGREQFPPRYEAMRAQATRVTTAPYSATFDIILSDLWGSDGSGIRPADLEEPCDDGPQCQNWVDFLTETIDRLGQDGLLKPSVRLDIWNEPAANSYFWPRSQAQYYQMWNKAVETIRDLYPAGIIVGPSTANFHGPTQAMYLDQAIAAGTLPDIWNWHFSTDPLADEAEMTALFEARGVPVPQFSMNEYLFAPEQNAGHTAWYLSRLQRSDLESASRAIWSNCCGSGLLDGILLPNNGGTTTTGEYWVYEAAAASGVVVHSEASADVDLLATRDDAARTATVLLGTRSFSGNLDVAVTGLGSAGIGASGAVSVQIKRLADGRLDAPVTVSNAVQRVTDGSIDVRIPWQLSTDAYTVEVTPALAGAGTVDSNTVGTGIGTFAYGPDWESAAGIAGAYAGTTTRSSSPGQLGTFTFVGDSVKLYGPLNSDQGILSVSVDGGAAVEIDTYSATRNPSALLWESSRLAAGTHVVSFAATGNSNPASGGTTVAIDRADVQRTVATIDADKRGPGPDRFSYGEGWGTAHGIPDLYAGTANWSSGANQSATFSFSGRQAWLYAVRDSDQGTMMVSVDGGAAVEVDNYAPAREPSARVWSSELLPAGQHTVTITTTGQGNPASSGSNVALDRAEFDQSNPNHTVDANVKGTGLDQVEYSSGWGSTSGVGDMYAGTANWSPTAGSTATFRFEGSRAVLRAVRDADQGILSVRIDGGPAVRVDAYSSSRDGSAALWDSGELAFGEHTIVATVTGDRHPDASGTTIALDCFDVTAEDNGVSATAPTVVNVSYSVPFGARDVLIPPVFGDGIPTSVAIASAPQNGTAVAAGVTLRYSAAVNRSGVDTLTYTATNAAGTSATATVTISVAADPSATAGPTDGPAETAPASAVPLPGDGGNASSGAAASATPASVLASTGAEFVVPGAIIALMLVAGGVLLARRRLLSR